MDFTFYVNIASLTLVAGSILLLLFTRPDKTKTRYLEEIAPDARYDVRIQKVLLTASATLGLVSSVLYPLVSTASKKVALEAFDISIVSDILNWSYIAILSILIVIATRHNVIFHLVCHLTAVGLLRVVYEVMLTAETIHLLTGRYSVPAMLREVDVILAIMSVIASVTLFTTGLNVPRAPRMEHNGKAVVSLAYSTLFQQMSFSYSERAQATSRENATLSLADLDCMPFDFRASTLLKRFSATREKYTLARRLWIVLKGPMTLQWILAAIAGMLMYAPAYFLLEILNFFETYKTKVDQGRPASIYTGLGWVFGMFAVKMVTTVVWSQLWWVSSAVLQVNARAAINTDIYSKTLRKQNTTGESAKVEKTVENDSEDLDKAAQKTASNSDDDVLATSKQNVMNLMTVDADRISRFFVFNFLGIQAPVEIVVAMTFLYRLVGWASIPGFLVLCLFVPLTSVTSSLYSKAQDRLMSARDGRVGLINELLQGVRQIKFQANEKYYLKKAETARNKELKQLGIGFLIDLAIDFSYRVAPVAITVVTFGVYSKFVAELTPSIAFTSLVIMNQMKYAINFIPEIIVEMISTWTSIKRIAEYLDSEEVDAYLLDTTDSSTEHLPIRLDDASFAFAGSKHDENAFKLQHITAEFPLGELSLISGNTGSGKSLLLAGILGEAFLAAGSVSIPRSTVQNTEVKFIPEDQWIQPNTIAYVAQTAWLENKTIQANILFGAPLVNQRYQETLHVCGLTADLQILEDGDQTEIGEKGINLSGGQKARVSLARAVYSRASVVILDDVLSALDAHIAKHVFEKCINGPLLSGRTRILVTHQVSLCLKTAKYVVALENGTIKHAGFVSDLKRTGSLEHIVFEEATKGVTQDAEDEVAIEQKGSVSTSSAKDDTATIAPANVPRKLVDEEAQFKGRVTLSTYLRYLGSQGPAIYTLLIFTLFLAEISLDTFGTFWIRNWSSSAKTSTTRMSIFRSGNDVPLYFAKGLIDFKSDHSLKFWVGFYLLIMLTSQIATLTGIGFMYWGSIHAGRRIYTKMLETIMKAPLRFLDTVPTGRLLNRFSKDAETVDSRMASNFSQFVQAGLQTIMILCICITVQPYFLVAAAFLVAVGVWIGMSYVTATRALKRLDSVNRSPMYEVFSATLSGITTIRAYGSADRFLEGMFEKVDNVTCTQFTNMVVNRWLSVRFDVVGSFYTVGVAVFLLAQINSIDAGLAGFTMSFALEMQEGLLWTIRYFAELEQSMNAVERMFEYTDIETEADHESAPGKAPPAAWPTEGTIEFRDLELKYAPELPSVLHKINFKVRPHEKIGIIGRTGSGKTTITLALFRFLEAHHGSISIDGLDISQMGLHDLRSRLTIVPQEPTLFQGTLRSNLSEEATDEELRDVLRRVHLNTDHAAGHETPASTTNVNVFDNLDYAVTEGGSNFSAGQRQLLCLARALLRRTKIIVMDEATASVDVETDALIQDTIRSEFIDSTVLTIAHRLATIIDYDRILVLDQGNVLEFDSPNVLLKDPESQFSKMVEAAKLEIPDKK